LWGNKVNIARDMKDNNMMSSEWIYKNIFNFSNAEIKKLDNEIVYDQKTKFRYSQIEMEGNDPAKSGQSQGTPSDLAMSRTGHELDFEEGGAPEGGFEGAGRPKEVSKYGKDGSARGRDPLGRPKIPIALAHYDGLKKSFGKKAREILKETMDSDEISSEYKNFKDDK